MGVWGFNNILKITDSDDEFDLTQRNLNSRLIGMMLLNINHHYIIMNKEQDINQHLIQPIKITIILKENHQLIYHNVLLHIVKRKNWEKMMHGIAQNVKILNVHQNRSIYGIVLIY